MMHIHTTALAAVLLATTAWHAAIGAQGSATDQPLHALAQALEDQDFGDALEAAKEAAGTMRVAEFLIDALRSERVEVRASAATALMIPEAAERVVPALAAALQDEDAAVRGNAASSLSGIFRHTEGAREGTRYKESVAPLAAALNDSDQNVRAMAAHALAALGQLAKPAQPTLQRRLKDDDELVRVNVAFALWRISKDNKDIVLPVLRDGITSGQWFVRQSAVHALGEMGPAAAGAKDELRRALGDDDEHVRRSAAVALGNIGEGASDVIPDLVKSLTDKSEYVRLLAAEAILRIDRDAGAPAVDAIRRMMQDTDVDFMVRTFAIETMMKYAERRVAIRAIEGLLSDEKDDPEVRGTAANALKKLRAQQ